MRISREFERPDGETPISVALGLFDGIHIGHKAVLSKALENKSLTPCVFTYKIESQVPDTKKNYTTLISEDQKWKIFEEMGFRLGICPKFDNFKSIAPKEFVEEMLIHRLRAKEITCGYDFTFGKDACGNVQDLIELARSHGVKVNVVKQVTLEGQAVSSTKIREFILQGKMDAASQMLGRRFSIDFEVSHGNQVGRMIQFPTINQVFPTQHIVPKYGVYATVVKVDNRYFGGVTNVGVKPTVGSDGPLAETYIMDFDGDLYGKHVEVRFFRFVRPETRFDSIHQLKEQISKDKNAVYNETQANITAVLEGESFKQYSNYTLHLPF